MLSFTRNSLPRIALFLARKRREHWRWVNVAVLGLTCLVQMWGLLIKDSGRPHSAQLGASPEWFVRILSGQVYLGTLLGSNQIAIMHEVRIFIFMVFVAIAGTAVVAICFLISNTEMKLFFAFSAAIFALSLAAAVAYPPPGVTVWETLAAAPGIHYWFFPTLAFAWSLLWCFRSPVQIFKVVSASLLFLMCVGILRDWRNAAFPDAHFEEYVKQFEAAPAGAIVVIPINPEGWDMRLVKH